MIGTDDLSGGIMDKEAREGEVAEISSSYVAGQRFYMEVVDDVMAAVLRQKTPYQRLLIADRLWTSARSLVRAAIISKEPNLSESEVDRKIAQRLCGVDIPNAAQ
jgi:hypothetical protein